MVSSYHVPETSNITSTSPRESPSITITITIPMRVHLPSPSRQSNCDICASCRNQARRL